MKTKYFLILSDGSGCTRMTSNEPTKVSEFWNRMLETFTKSGARLLEYRLGRFVVDLDGRKKECEYGKYQYEDADPYSMAITL